MNPFLSHSARPLSRLIVRVGIVLLLGGFLGATLVRLAPNDHLRILQVITGR
jgi:uncharacterized membrane protein YfcA